MAKEYTVLHADELTRLGPMNKIEQYYHVTIQTKGGVVRSCDVPATDFTPEKMGPILLKLATDTDKILAL